MESLAEEVLLVIFSYVSPIDLLSGCSRVSTIWKRISEDEELWYHHCVTEFPIATSRKLRRERYGLQIGQDTTNRALYMECKKSEMNWMPRSSDSPDQSKQLNAKRTILEGHSDKITCFKLIQDRRTKSYKVFSGSKDSLLIEWDIGTEAFGLKRTKVYSDHEGPILCIDYEESSQLILTGSEDFLIKIWSIYDSECIRTLDGHTEAVNIIRNASVQISPEKSEKIHLVISGSLDTSIIVWNMKNGDLIHKLEGHRYDITCLELLYYCHNDIVKMSVVSGSRDGTIRIWDPLQGECLREIARDYGYVLCMSLCDQSIAVGYSNGIISIYACNFQEEVVVDEINKINTMGQGVYCLQNEGKWVVGGGRGMNVELWEIMSSPMGLDIMHNQRTIGKHSGRTTCLYFDDTKVVSGSIDCTVKIHGFKDESEWGTLSAHMNTVEAIQVYSDVLVSSSGDGTLVVYNYSK